MYLYIYTQMNMVPLFHLGLNIFTQNLSEKNSRAYDKEDPHSDWHKGLPNKKKIKTLIESCK